MASNASTTAGTTIAVSSSLPATYNASGFSALTYTAAGEITDVGEYGKEYALVTHTPIADRKTYKFKGSYNNGSLSLQMASYPADSGQAILITGLDSDASISFKITHQNGDVDYFTGKIMSYRVSVGGADAIKMATVAVEIDSDIVAD